MKGVQVAQNLQYPDWRCEIAGYSTSGNSAYVQYGSFNSATGSNAANSPIQLTWLHDGLSNNSIISCHKFMSGRNFFITGTNASSNQNGTIGSSQFFVVAQDNSGTLTKKSVTGFNGRVLDLEPIGTVSGAHTFMVLWTNDNGIYIQAFTVDSAGSLTAGTSHSLSGTNGFAEAENGKFAWNSDYTRVGVAWVRQSDEKAWVTSGTWNGTAFSWAAGNQLNGTSAVGGNDWGGGVAIACDRISGKYVATYQTSSESKAVCIDPGSNGLNSNPGTAITVHASNPDGNFAICDSYAVENAVYWAGKYGNNLGHTNLIISGTNTLSHDGISNLYNQSPHSDCNIGVGPEKFTLSTQTYYSVYTVFRYNSDWYRARSRVSTAGTNATTHNIIGFAPSAISDGATGTVNTNGNTIDNQSGLTAGTKYYVQNDGTIGTSYPSRAAGGVGLSSSKLLITT